MNSRKEIVTSLGRLASDMELDLTLVFVSAYVMSSECLLIDFQSISNSGLLITIPRDCMPVFNSIWLKVPPWLTSILTKKSKSDNPLV